MFQIRYQKHERIEHNKIMIQNVIFCTKDVVKIFENDEFEILYSNDSGSVFEQGDFVQIVQRS